MYGVSPKKKQLAEYLRQHPGVSYKSYIARETGMDRTTVQKYYDEVRAERSTVSSLEPPHAVGCHDQREVLCPRMGLSPHR